MHPLFSLLNPILLRYVWVMYDHRQVCVNTAKIVSLCTLFLSHVYSLIFMLIFEVPF
jgi:hypothetical protein